MAPAALCCWGHNGYGDAHHRRVFQKKYGRLAAKAECPTLWRSSVAVRAVWDDHDYGRHDAGAEYEHKEASEDIFLDFWKVPPDADRRQHPGIYGVEMFEDEGHLVQLILLDTRYFREPVAPHRLGDGGKNDYIPHSEAGAAFLGEAQWAWLEEVLQQAATVRILATSTQFGHEYNGWESWTNFPFERARMVQTIRTANAGGVLFISGDVHWGEISRYDPDQGYPFYDVTSSGITQSWPTTEPNTNRIGPVIQENNFGLIDIDWSARSITLQLHNQAGQVVAETQVGFDALDIR